MHIRDEQLRGIALGIRRTYPPNTEGLCEQICDNIRKVLWAQYHVFAVIADNPPDSQYPHCWLEFGDGRILDPCFDQFCSEEHQRIYIGYPTEFHKG